MNVSPFKHPGGVLPMAMSRAALVSVASDV